jgi:hypothetical protein
MTKEDEKVKEQAVDIIIAATENIKHRDQFDDEIILEVVPERSKGIEETSITPCVTRPVYIAEIFPGIG